MKRIIKLLLFYILFVLVASPFAQMVDTSANGITSVASSQDGENMVISYRLGGGSQVLLMSLVECLEIKRYHYDAIVNGALYSNLEPNKLWIGHNDLLKKIDAATGAEEYSINPLALAIDGIAQSDDGRYLVAWGKNRLALYLASADGLELLMNKSVTFEISDLIFDSYNSNVYISGKNGGIVKYDIRGVILNSFDLDQPINAISVDGASGRLLVATGSGVLLFDIANSVVTRVSAVKSDDVALAKDGFRLNTISDGIYSKFSYPNVRLLGTNDLYGADIYPLPNGSTATYGKNAVYLYDDRRGANVGRVYVLPTGSGFVSAEYNYYGNETFLNALNDNNLPDIRAYSVQGKEFNRALVCRDFYTFIKGVYRPTGAGLNVPLGQESPTAPQVVAPVVPSVTAPNTPAVEPTKPAEAPTAPNVTAPISPAVPPVNDNVSTSSVPTPTPPAFNPPVVQNSGGNVSSPTPPVAPTAPANPATPQLGDNATSGQPQVNIVLPPSLAPGSNVPMWVMQPSALPSYSAVKSGADAATALTAAKLKIREDVARGIMKEMLESELLNGMTNADVKKRFLWMVAGQTAQLASEYAMQKDLWVSPEGQFYVLAEVPNNDVMEIYAPIFNAEHDNLRTIGDAGYLNAAPYQWK